ncbi:unnamed protein product [Haemonchus placei]|uniref:CASP-like protein n=1 Tax=Haemonchus placei TaxID=6290 RepID=A0A0N4VYA5_HAEPC|nr:unnamed protein product [Haemonchus placei]
MAWDVCTYAMTAGASGASAAISSKFAFGHYAMEKDFVVSFCLSFFIHPFLFGVTSQEISSDRLLRDSQCR